MPSEHPREVTGVQVDEINMRLTAPLTIATRRQGSTIGGEGFSVETAPGPGPIGGRSMRRGVPVITSQVRIVLSCETLINCLPSGVNSTVITLPMCPPVSRTRIVSSFPLSD